MPKYSGNTVITEDFYILGDGPIINVPGCVCAFFDYCLVYCVVHEDGRTKILLGTRENDTKEFKFKTVIDKDEIISIINISAYTLYDKDKYVFSSREGVRFVLNNDGKKKRLDDHIPINTVSILTVEVYPELAISYDGQATDIYRRCIVATANGYCKDSVNRVIGWTDYSIFEIDTEDECSLARVNHDKCISDVYVDQFYDDDTRDVIFILSERAIHVILVRHGEILRTCNFRGEWNSAPFYVDGCLCAIDIDNVVRDIRTAWAEYNEFSIVSPSWKDSKTISPKMLHSIALENNNLTTKLLTIVQDIYPERDQVSPCHGMKIRKR